MNNKPYLSVGDRAWYYHDALINIVDVLEVKIILENDPQEFAMYTVKRYYGDPVKHVHRSELFKAPGERKKLLEKLENDSRYLDDCIRELETQDEEHVPEVGDDV